MVSTATTNCAPQGELSRDGRIVNVTLNVVLADFKINNPDKTTSPTGEDAVRLRSYGGCKAGPLIDVLPGNAVRLTLKNNLSKDDPSCQPNPPSGLGLGGSPGVGCFNTVNLHTHGLHVSPAGNSDNVLLSLSPQTTFPYEFNLPEDHPAGTFWYHAHMHGSTAVQVGSGATGVFVVRGNRPYTPPTPANPHPIADIDTILKNAKGTAMPEQFFQFQQISYACFQNLPNQAGGPWQAIYTTKGLYKASNDSKDPANSAAWTCPEPAPGKPVSPGAVENFGLQLNSPSIWDTNGRFTSVNGVVQPTLTVPAGEIQRWRFIHAGTHDTINVQVVKAQATAGKNLITASALVGNRQTQKDDVIASCAATSASMVPQFEIATDGLTRKAMRTIGAKPDGFSASNFLQSGYRSDILVVFPEDGDYCLLNQAAPAQARPQNGGGGGQGPSTPQLLAYVHVRGGTAVKGDLETYVKQALFAGNPQLPVDVRAGLLKGDLTAWAPFLELAPPPPGSKPQLASFSITVPSTPTDPVLFQVNGVSYNPDVVNVTRQVNTTDDWILSASGVPSFAAEPHIFHIHVNPFEVMDVTFQDKDGKQESIYESNGQCKATVLTDKQGLANQYCGMYHTFRDTVFVENGYQVHIRTHYERYIGEFVLHCHILDHEDGGMMQNISIVPDLTAPGGGIGMGRMKHQHQ
jgi:FtsP/CotA-like multicopper oxidase with cupredoxin domain